MNLDAVVVDGDERPVRGLIQDDFDVKEDGRAVAVTSFKEVSAAGIAGREDSRSVVLLLDDMGVPAIGTTVIQRIARLVLAETRPADTVAVVRLTHHDDEAVGPPQLALDRIDNYRAKTLPYFGIESIQDALEAITRISRQLPSIPLRRTALVCIGRRSICDPYFERPEYSRVSEEWRDALSSMARANVGVYLIDPTGVAGRLDLGNGLVDHSGGVAFVLSNTFTAAVDAIWREASHYYLLGYTPTAARRDLHSINVSVKPRRLHVHARLQRGD